jgi:hypothetical protein
MYPLKRVTTSRQRKVNEGVDFDSDIQISCEILSPQRLLSELGSLQP